MASPIFKVIPDLKPYSPLMPKGTTKALLLKAINYVPFLNSNNSFPLFRVPSGKIPSTSSSFNT